MRCLQSDGFVDLGQLDPSLPSDVTAMAVARMIGAAVISAPEVLQVSLPETKGLNTYGGNYGLGALPLHTDLAHWYRPPRYVMLRCILGSPIVSTTVVHHGALLPMIPMPLMKRAIFSPRRRLEGKMYLLHLLTDEIFRWDELFLVPKNQPAIEVRQRMLDVLSGINVTRIVLDQVGQTLVIDNWHALHGRSSVPDSEISRRLERVYLEGVTDGHEDTA